MVPAPSATDIDRLGQENDFIFPADGAHPYKRDLTDLEFHLLDTGHLVLEDKAYEVFPHEFPQPQARRLTNGQPHVRLGWCRSGRAAGTGRRGAALRLAGRQHQAALSRRLVAITRPERLAP